MSIAVQCPNPACGKTMQVKEQFAGKTGKCPACGSPVTVPALRQTAESLVAAAPNLISVTCRNADCGRTFQVKDRFAGKTGKCPGCGQAVTVPRLGEEAAPAVNKETEDLPGDVGLAPLNVDDVKLAPVGDESDFDLIEEEDDVVTAEDVVEEPRRPAGREKAKSPERPRTEKLARPPAAEPPARPVKAKPRPAAPPKTEEPPAFDWGSVSAPAAEEPPAPPVEKPAPPPKQKPLPPPPSEEPAPVVEAKKPAADVPPPAPAVEKEAAPLDELAALPEEPSRAVQPPTPAAPPTTLSSTEAERNLAMLCHFSPALTSFVGPLAIWLSKREESKFVDYHGREVLNFLLHVFAVQAILAFFALGSWLFSLCLTQYLFGGFLLFFLLFLLVGTAALVMLFIGGKKAKAGELWCYPHTFRVIPLPHIRVPASADAPPAAPVTPDS